MRKEAREPWSFCVFLGDLGGIVVMKRYELVHEFKSAASWPTLELLSSYY